MNGDWLSALMLPLMLAFIMFSLGLGLLPTDFRRIAAHPRAFFLGVLCHFILLPLTCLVLLHLFPLPGALAVGFMLIAACPTGTTSNLLTYIARGDVALALTFTAAASLLTVVSLPLIMSFSMQYFLGADSGIVMPTAMLIKQVVLMLALPVGLGMLARHWLPELALRIEKGATRLSSVCFLVIVVASVVRNWTLFELHFSSVAPLAIGLNVLMLGTGFVVARIGRLDRRQAVTLAIETAMQNATLAIVIGGSVLNQPEMVIPGAIYGVLMYTGGLAFAFAVRGSLAPLVTQKRSAP